MNELAAAALLGLVQGLTEFLPVSSTGHLIIAGAVLHLDTPGLGVFEVAIQFGSILAVVLLYRQQFFALFRPNPAGGFSGLRGMYLLFLTCLPACVLGALLHKTITTYLFNPISVSLALLAGALFILFAEKKGARAEQTQAAVSSLDAITPGLALAIGCFQCLALWPGFSRSTATIMGGILLGAKRSVAAEYSFIAAVPIMLAATVFSLLTDAAALSRNDIPFFAVGMLTAFAAAIAAIKLLVRLISRISFRPFALYRLCIAPLILWFWL